MQIVNGSLKRLHTAWFQLYNILEEETSDIGNIYLFHCPSNSARCSRKGREGGLDEAQGILWVVKLFSNIQWWWIHVITHLSKHTECTTPKANRNVNYWRRQWHPTPVLLPGKSHGWRSLVGCSPWGRQSDTTEWLYFHFSLSCIGEGNGNPLQCSCLENLRTGKPGGLPSLGSHRVGHDWSDLAAAM